MANLRLHKGDMVQVITGSFKGQTGKVVAVLPKLRAVKVEGINNIKRHVKPSVVQPQGGIQQIHQPIDISKVALVHPTKKAATSRVGYQLDKDGNKKRIYKQVKISGKHKEIA